jgi:hypothetical protein
MRIRAGQTHHLFFAFVSGGGTAIAIKGNLQNVISGNLDGHLAGIQEPFAFDPTPPEVCRRVRAGQEEIRYPRNVRAFLSTL